MRNVLTKLFGTIVVAVGRSRHFGRRGRIPLAGIAGQERLRLLRPRIVRSFERVAARRRHCGAILRPKLAHGMDSFEEPALRFPGAEPDMEDRPGRDIDPAQAIRQDLCRRRLRQSRPRGHAEFHRGEWTRRLGHFRRREPAGFIGGVSQAIR